jgi:spoIIIJ-associated protein
MRSTEGTYRGPTLDEALTQACTELRARVGELHYEVVAEEVDGPVAIRAEVDPVAVLGLFLSETFRAGELDVAAQISMGDEALDGELSGSDLRVLTGGGGKGLDALQYLCNRVLTRRVPKHPPVHLDTDGFKARRARQLQDRAEAAADDALRRGNPVVIGPLTPAARREIHLALADDPAVETSSDGEGFLKRVVIRPRRRR